MNVDPCQRPKKMMGRGAAGGCGTGERPYRPFRGSSLKEKWSNGDAVEDSGSPEIGFLAQASKTLCERSPFDVPEDGSTSGLSVPTLPIGLANLWNHSDSRKRHKKSHSGTDYKKKKKTSRQGEKLRVGSIWVEHEDYFRNIDFPDIETLSGLASFRSLCSRNCFSVPLMGCEPFRTGQCEIDGTEKLVKNEDVVSANDVVREEANNCVEEEVHEGYVEEETVKEDVEQPMNIDNAGAESVQRDDNPDNICSETDYSGSLEWILGCRDRILLTTERPSKKLRLLGSDAGLRKLMVVCPSEGDVLLCDFCCTGDAKEYPDLFIVCNSCKATVHKRCYGVHEDVDKSWLCTWCKQKNGQSDFERPCVLCPKKGGALKPVVTNTENGGLAEFAHLFCSQWMPELYIGDLKKMEPILNFSGIKETRKKLVCNLCKVKYGACIQCSNGTCRTSFHPTCAREAGNRLEVWGKHDRDIVELTAFCSKHSDVQEGGRSLRRGGESNIADSRSLVSHLPSKFIKEGHLIDANMSVNAGRSGTNFDISGNSELLETESPHSKLSGSMPDSVESGMSEKSDFNEIALSESLSFGLILKKLIDRGKVDVKDVAAEIGITPDALSSKLTDGNLMPELRGKIIKWLGKHAYICTWHKGGNVKSNDNISIKSESKTAVFSEDIAMRESDISDPAVTESVYSERKNKSKRHNNNNTNYAIICAYADNSLGNGIVDDEVKAELIKEEESSVDLASEHSEDKKSIVLDGKEHHEKSSVNHNDNQAKPSIFSRLEGVTLMNTFSLGHNPSRNHQRAISDLLNSETNSGLNIHPYIRRELSQMCKGVTPNVSIDSDANGNTSKSDGSEGEVKHPHSFSSGTICCNHQNQHPDCNNTFCLLSKASNLGILDLAPEDEVEGELLYSQLRLIGNAAIRMQLCDNLGFEVAKKLPLEIDEEQGQRWDCVLVNKYFYDLREARKQGRKEKRHKEAQAALAQQEMSASRRKAGGVSHPVPQAKETLLKTALSGTPSEKLSDQCTPDFSVENSRSCDICRRSETIRNLILVCCSCKVAVHLDCYRSAKESSGPWYCELCLELSSSRSSGPLNFWEKTSSTECAFCGGATGAFRKATNGQWVHGFCAEWVLESSFRRGQVDPVQGMESVPMNMNICCVCRQKHGACIKCSYGNCQTAFHPSCARSAGLYMSGGGKLPHKAYCKKHSVEPRAKAETQKHGAEEMKNLKQYRVELERLRLLCERIVKREKLKRELVISSHEILAVKRDNVVRSLLSSRRLFPPEVSSDSATTSVKGHPDSNKSGSEAIQRSDDVTIDSTLSVKRRGKGPILMDLDQKNDDSVTSKTRFSRKPTERKTLSGKTIPRRHYIVSPTVSGDGKPKKEVETFAKEMVMTSDEATMKNRRLPKGYFYVPVDCLQEDGKPAANQEDTGEDDDDDDNSGKDG
ncbi:PREDICTED: uncharacterized protein LOC104813639 isoform X3 [Tarenaya hassleriana]|uniref:uncharacterized protein LOC104813639 isoform X3 n=1 Tax=Tarenaya hassleriana TaxID=28532 RepID=UPI0008FD298B|nr:PREDICTED: uncharacterized protein LOC104813639 isoform X3 [Tarenaya hassleriana]